VCRQERVVQREVSDLAAEHQPGVVIEAKCSGRPGAAVPPGDEPMQVPASRTGARPGAARTPMAQSWLRKPGNTGV